MTSPDPEDRSPPSRSEPAEGSSPDAGRAGERPDHTRGGHPQLPDDVDSAFAAIVADWAATDAPRWPGEPPDHEPSSGVGAATPPGGRPATEDPGPAAVPQHPASPRPPGGPGDEDSDDGDTDDGDTDDGDTGDGDTDGTEDHFVPPEPPPLPRLGLSSMAGLLLLVVGVVLLAVPGLLGSPLGLGIVPGLLAMTAGLGWLVFGLRRPQERGDGSGPDDGAVL